MNHASAEMKLTPVSFLRNLPANGRKRETRHRQNSGSGFGRAKRVGMSLPAADPRTSAARTAAALVAARRGAWAVDPYPGVMPADLVSAYAVQDEAIAAWPNPVAGWKLGRIPPPHDAAYGAGRLAGPIFADAVWQAGAAPTAFGVIENGFAAVEAEYVFEIGETAPDRDGWTPDAARGLVARVLAGVEIAGSPFAGINDNGPAVTASDFGNNAGLILGGEIPDGLDRLMDLHCAMRIDGRAVGAGGAEVIPGGPLASLAFLLNLLHARGRRLEAGQWVSTGAATGVHRIYAGQSAEADFGPDGTIACRAVRAEPVT